MELRHLRYFIAVAEELHFARAAERVGIEQSPLSRAIRELELDLGVSLFVRTSRSTRMTKAGESFLVDARRLLTETRQIARRARSTMIGKASCLRLGFSQAVADARLSRLLALSHREEPDVTFSLLQAPTSQLPTYLKDGAIDVAVSCTEIYSGGLISHPIWSVPLVAVISVSHPLAVKTSLQLEEVLDQPSVIADSELRQGCGALRSAMEVSSVSGASAVVEMAASGIAVGIAPLSQLAGLTRPDIVVTKFDDPGMIITAYVILRRTEKLSACGRLLCRALQPSC
jgi:DNA-binding transcriptional LysR family regulator